MKRVPSLYESVDWEDTDSDPGEEEFSNTTELRKRFLFFKKFYSDLKFLKVRATIEDEFHLDKAKKELLTVLKRIFRIEKISVFLLKNNEFKASSTADLPEQGAGDLMKSDVTKLSDSLQVGKAADVTRQANKYVSLQPLLKKYSSNFCFKVKGERFDENFVLVYIFHFEYQSLKILFENSSLCSKIEALLLRYADLMVEHSLGEVIINYEMYMETLRYYMEMVNSHMEVFMIPRLINNLEESVKTQVIWVNDAVNIAMYKHIDKSLFLGLHPLNKTPYLLNYAASEANMELNFEITTVWGCLKDWIYKEKINLDNAAMNDKLSGNFILQFNKHYELIYINDYDRAELQPFLQFPERISAQADLKLEAILKHKVMWESINAIITSLIESGERESEMSKPNINIRITLDEKGRLRGFTLIFKTSLMNTVRNNDPFADFEYAVTPISIIKNNDDDLENLTDNAQSVYSGRESIFSGIKRKLGPVEKGNTKKSAFGTRNRQPDSPGRVEGQPQMESGAKLIAPKKPGAKLQKQASRFTVEGSLFSEAQSGQNSLRGYKTSAAPRRKQPPKLFSGDLAQEDDDSKAKYRKIEERVNKSIVMEYMQSLDEDRSAYGSRAVSGKNSHEILPELDQRNEEDEQEQFVKSRLDQKRKKYTALFEHMKIKPDTQTILDIKLNFDVKHWNFNALDQSANYLIATVREIFETRNFFKDFSIQSDIFVNFVWQCHYFYTRNNNPFHNFFHGVTVCHAGFYFLQHNSHLSSLLEPHLQLAFVTACLGHDLDHRGRNNPFEINTRSKLAIRYFDKSPLENHHAATLLTILRAEDSDIFKSVADDKLKEIKLNIIENILATDMKLHFPLLADFKKKIADCPEICTLLSPVTPADILEASRVFTHCADLSGSCKEYAVASRWSHFVNREFIEQYNEEKQLGIPESAHFKNLTDPQGYLSSEIGFIDVILAPLFEAANEFMKKDLSDIMENLKETRETYQSRLDELKLNSGKSKASNN